MKLSKFISSHLEEILSDWVEFARSLHPATTATSTSDLRDHGQQILEAIALDIETDETAAEQMQKSVGHAADAKDGVSAAASHGKTRYDTGFSLVQVIAEYRAMRASVLRLWMPQMKQITEQASKDMLRFNESIDQALAESAQTFSEETARTRDTFLAILGHDLRSPLGTAANVNDVTQGHALLHGEEVDVFADAGYQGATKRPEATDVKWHITMRPGKRKTLDKETKLGAMLDKIEKLKASVRAKVEHPFRVIKRQFGFTKVRYRGLVKNTAQLVTLFALSNLWMVRRQLIDGAPG